MNCGLHFPLVHRRRSPASFTQNVFFRQHPRRTADVPAKLNSSQLRRHVGGKGLRWLLLPTAYVLICRNGIPGSTGDCVAGSSAAYENQALVIVIKKLCGLPDLLRSVSCLYRSPPPCWANVKDRGGENNRT